MTGTGSSLFYLGISISKSLNLDSAVSCGGLRHNPQSFWRLKRLVTPLYNRRYINNFIYLSIYLTRPPKGFLCLRLPRKSNFTVFYRYLPCLLDIGLMYTAWKKTIFGMRNGIAVTKSTSSTTAFTELYSPMAITNFLPVVWTFPPR